MTKPVSARRARIAERRAFHSVIIAIVIAVVLGGIFLVVFLPLLVRGALWLAQQNRGATVDVGDTIPPQVPAFQPPDEYRKESRLEIQGFTEPKAEVKVVVDADEAASTKADDSGSFKVSLALTEAEHQMYLYAKDEAGNESALTTTYRIVVDTTTPTLTLDQPAEGAVFTVRKEQTITVSGKVSEKATVFVNGRRVTTNEEGNFETQYQLGEGSNTLTIRAEDPAGNAAPEMTRTVEFRP